MLEAVERLAPQGDPAPAVFDSPHSGDRYPDDFDFTCDPALLRRSEDMYVDALFGAAPAHGAPLLRALFPRCYIDPNRALDDLDPGLLDGPWPEPLAPGTKTARGVGLIWRRLYGRIEIYDRRLGVAEARRRIEAFWRPYHDALAREIDALHARFGAVWHVDCHSMPSMGDESTEDGPVPRAEFVLGDRDGTSCAPGFTAFVAERLRALGYEVRLNDPYKGMELVRRYADPAAGRHSLQIEINRRLYMDEQSFEKTPGFARLQADLSALAADICGYARAQVAG